MHTPGPMAEHSLSDPHARHVSVAALQIGAVPEHWVLLVHVTHWPAKIPVAAHAVLPSVRETQRAAVQPMQAFPTQKLLATLAVQPLLSTHSTHSPAEVPLVAHAGLAPLQAFAPAPWQPVHALLTQKPFEASFVQVVLSTHSTHWPAADPPVAQTEFVPPSTFPPHSVAVHPVQALFTQKPLAGFFVQLPLLVHSTHWPATGPVVAQTAAPPSTSDEQIPAVHPVHMPATQKPFFGSVQSSFTPQVPAASGTRRSTARSGAGKSTGASAMAISPKMAVSPKMSGGLEPSAGTTGTSLNPSFEIFVSPGVPPSTAGTQRNTPRSQV
jgi:hypothetical protein